MLFRPFCVAAVLLLSTSVASAQYVWLGRYNGSPNPWRLGSWAGGVPPVGGGSTVTILFPNPDGVIGYTTNYDRGDPFLFNRLTFTSAGGLITVAADSTFGSNSLQTAGTDPRIVQDGLGTVLFQNGGPDTTTFGGATIGGTGLGRVVFGSAIAGTGGLTLDFAQPRPTSGRVILQAPDTNPNNFTGNITLNAGNLTLGSHVNPLGNVGNMLVVNGGTIGVQQTPTPIVVPNPVSLNADLLFTGAADMNGVRDLTFSNAISQGSGSRHIEVRGVNGNGAFGAGTLILRGANTYSGNTFVGFSPHYEGAEVGTGGVTFSGGAGSALNSPEFSINDGGTLTLDSAVAGNHSANNRIHDTARVALNGSHFRLNGAANAATSEVVGPLDIAGGSAVTVNAGATGNAGTSVQFSSLQRVGRSAVFFRANNASFGGAPGAATANVTFTTAPSLAGGGGAPGATNVSILPFAYGATALSSNGTELVTYAANGIRPLAPAEYATTLPAGVTLQNVKLSAQAAFTGTSTVNALVLSTGNPFTTGSSGTITVSSGTVLATGGVQVRSEVGLDFGGSEAHLIVASAPTSALILSGVVSGTNGLTKSGPGVLRLTNSGNTISGPAGLTINEGTVEFQSLFALGTLSSVTVNGKTAGRPPGLRFLGPSPVTLSMPATVNGGFVSFGSNVSSATLTLSNAIHGTGGVVIDSDGDVRLNSTASTYSGTTRVHAGRLLLVSDAHLGNSPTVALVTDASAGSPGRLRLEGDWTTARTLRIADSTALSDFAEVDTNGFNATVNAPLVGAGQLRKTGAGRLTLTQPTDFGQGISSSVLVQGGELRVTNSAGSATGFAHVQVHTGATLSGTGRIAGSLLMADGSALSPGSDGVGTLRVDSNVTIAGRYRVDVAGSTSDRLSLSATLQIDPTSVLEISGTLTPGATYTLADYRQLAANQTFGSIVGLPSSHQFVIGSTEMQLTPVPEPTGIIALALAGAAAGRLFHRRTRRATAPVDA